ILGQRDGDKVPGLLLQKLVLVHHLGHTGKIGIGRGSARQRRPCGAREDEGRLGRIVVGLGPGGLGGDPGGVGKQRDPGLGLFPGGVERGKGLGRVLAEILHVATGAAEKRGHARVFVVQAGAKLGMGLFLDRDHQVMG
ncbi:MAG: hypothetical protein ACK56I_36170, partial [bacterium]